MNVRPEPSAYAANLAEEGCFADSLAHLLGEMERIDLLIQVQVQRARVCHAGDPEFQGLVIPEVEVDSLLARPCGLPRWADTAVGPDIQNACAKLRHLKASLDQRTQASLANGIPLRLEALVRLFSLSALDRDILLVCLAPELDLRYEKLYAYLQDDVTKKRPSVDLILNLLCATFPEKMQARTRFLSGSRLMKERLVQLFVDPSQPEPPLLRKCCKLDERIVGFLLEEDALVEPLESVVTWSEPTGGLKEVWLPEDRKERLRAITRQQMVNRQSLLLYFQGNTGSGRLAAAEALCREMGLRLLVADGRKICDQAERDFQKLVQLLAREALLSRAAVYWENVELLLKDDKAWALEGLLNCLNGKVPLSFLAGETAWEPGAQQLCASAFVRIEFAVPKDADRLLLWDRLLPSEQRAADVDLGVVSTRFRLNVGRIEAAVKTAANLARWRDPANGRVGMHDLYAACRLQSHHQLADLARKIEPKYSFADIILPPDQLEQLREILAQAKLRHIVLGQWGFERKLSLGKGLNVLFSGPPGTGKTMAAEVIASELGLDLYKINLSRVVSKYIGETEKNLDRIFREAHGSNAILFFDEADSLFGKRSEVKDAHDRYANIEIGYLLQKMEEYEGIAILATNLRQNLDEAFVRRLHVIVEFPFPDPDNRRRIWEKIWPGETPRAPDVDLDSMAKQFEITGGNIRNIALAAGFLAAADGRVVRMSHLVRATQREYQKMGKVVVDGEFEKYPIS